VRIVADENIPAVGEAFGGLGEVVTCSGRAITAAMVRDADVLLVRSVTRVDEALLQGSRVRFVATATIGTDHIDTAYLDAAGIGYASAPGSNADSVADWLVAVLLEVARLRGMRLEGRTLGVIGCGHVGSRVVRRARALGMRVIENDPPLARKTGDPRYRPLDELTAADIISLHTPLTLEGPDATHHLIGGLFLERLRPDAIVINAGRGPCLDGAALKAALRAGRLGGAALDVWETEPDIDPELLDTVLIGTPHIAGYSLDGKLRGTEMILDAVCRWAGAHRTWSAAQALLPPEVPELSVSAAGREDEDVLREIVTAVYPVRRDDAALRQALRLATPDERIKAFDRLRRDYPVRREFSFTRVRLSGATETLAAKISGIGFVCERMAGADRT
jgi:erythronate-4-phosphate dehydrogenase